MGAVLQEIVRIESPRGWLAGELAYSETDVTAAVLLISPHPLMGGRMDNRLVARLAERLAATTDGLLPGVVFGVSGGEAMDLAIKVFLVSIFVQVVISWINPGLHNPMTSLLYSLNEPLLAPARRAIPPISGLDLSALVVLVGLQLASILVVPALRDLARLLH